MKVDEIVFFIHCYVLRMNYGRNIRDIVNDFEGLIHHKRCWYLLKKWAGIGFYNYGVTLDLGWFESPFFMPERYRTILEKIGFCEVRRINYCPWCGTELFDDLEECHHCGKKLNFMYIGEK